MIIREIVRTCSNPHVAHAAVASIGGDFARRFSSDAEKRNLTSGLFAAGLVRRFSRHAAERDWEGVGEATRGADQPILSGLRYILERGVEFLTRVTPIPAGVGSPPTHPLPAARLCGTDEVGRAGGLALSPRSTAPLKPDACEGCRRGAQSSPCILGLIAEPPGLRRF